MIYTVYNSLTKSILSVLIQDVATWNRNHEMILMSPMLPQAAHQDSFHSSRERKIMKHKDEKEKQWRRNALQSEKEREKHHSWYWTYLRPAELLSCSYTCWPEGGAIALFLRYILTEQVQKLPGMNSMHSPPGRQKADASCFHVYSIFNLTSVAPGKTDAGTPFRHLSMAALLGLGSMQQHILHLPSF